MLNFSCVKPIRTVYSILEAHGALDLLRDDLIGTATQEIQSEGRSRREIQRDIKSKERAIETLASRYERKSLSQENIRQCLYSIGDNHAFLRTNRDPCERMIKYLQDNFHPNDFQRNDPKSSLAIRSGKNGARLSHDHSKQYAYVLQSLTLWREILHGACRSQVNFSLYLLLCNQTCFIYGRWRSKTYSQKTFRTDFVIQVRVSIAFRLHPRQVGWCILFFTARRRV